MKQNLRQSPDDGIGGTPNQKDLTWLLNRAKMLKETKFFGRLELIYQGGKIVAFHKTETGKPE